MAGLLKIEDIDDPGPEPETIYWRPERVRNENGRAVSAVQLDREYFRNEALRYSARALGEIVRIADDLNVDATTRLKAWQFIYERAHGKAAQSVSIRDARGIGDLSDTELDALIVSKRELLEGVFTDVTATDDGDA